MTGLPVFAFVADLLQHADDLAQPLDQPQRPIVGDVAGGVLEIARVLRHKEDALQHIGVVHIGVVGQAQALVGVARGNISYPDVGTVALFHLGGLADPGHLLANSPDATGADNDVKVLVVFAKGVAVVGIVKDETTVFVNLVKEFIGRLAPCSGVVLVRGALGVEHSILVHLLVGPGGDSVRRQSPGLDLGAIPKPGWGRRVGLEFVWAKGVDAVNAGRNVVKLGAGLPGVGLLPGQVAVTDDCVALVRVLADAVGIGLGVAADAAVPAIIVPGETNGEVGGHFSLQCIVFIDHPRLVRPFPNVPQRTRRRFSSACIRSRAYADRTQRQKVAC